MVKKELENRHQLAPNQQPLCVMEIFLKQSNTEWLLHVGFFVARLSNETDFLLATTANRNHLL